jgi:hypothetical protein
LTNLPGGGYHGRVGFRVNGKRKNPFGIICAALLLMVLYFFLFPYPLGRERVARPAWALDIAGAAGDPAEKAAGVKTAFFQLGGSFGFVDSDGSLLYKDAPLFRVALTDAGFINFTRMGSTWIFQDIRGERIFSFTGSGYPMMSRDAERVFTATTDLTGIREYDRGGELLWSRDFPSLITCVSLGRDGVLVGMMNVTLQLLGRSGEVLADQTPAGSRISVILGCAQSEDGASIAAVSGVGGQYLTVLEKQGSSYHQVSRVLLGSDFRREVRIAFSPDGTYCAVEGSRAVQLYDCSSRRLLAMPLNGGLDGMAFLPDRGSAAFLSGAGGRGELVLTLPFGVPFYRESFPSRSAYLGEIDGAVLLGIDTMLIRIDVEEM